MKKYKNIGVAYSDTDIMVEQVKSFLDEFSQNSEGPNIKMCPNSDQNVV